MSKLRIILELLINLKKSTVLTNSQKSSLIVVKNLTFWPCLFDSFSGSLLYCAGRPLYYFPNVAWRTSQWRRTAPFVVHGGAGWGVGRWWGTRGSGYGVRGGGGMGTRVWHCVPLYGTVYHCMAHCTTVWPTVLLCLASVLLCLASLLLCLASLLLYLASICLIITVFGLNLPQFASIWPYFALICLNLALFCLNFPQFLWHFPEILVILWHFPEILEYL